MALLPRPGLAAVLALILSSAAGEVRADLIIGNLPQSSSATQVNVGQSLSYAMEFTMGGTAYSLTDAQLVLTLSAPTSSAPVLTLYSGGTTPGSVLKTFTTPAGLAIGTELVDFTTSYTLQANTSYWLVLSGAANGAYFDWQGSHTQASPNGIAPTGSGATQAGLATGSGNPSITFTAATVGAATPYASYQLNGTALTATPEPSTMVMAGVGGVCFLAARRLRSAKARSAA